jgi:pimeloyl-ACP methyl ester carboxylesterase
MNFILHIITLSVAILIALFLNTFKNTLHVPIDIIQQDGGHVFKQEDGRITEYFLYGDHFGVPLVFFHGASLTGSAASSWDKIAKENKVYIISLSMAGWGGSSPQRGRSYADGGHDAFALLSHLGLGNSSICIIGVSWGSGTAAAMAQLQPHRVRSLLLIVPTWPSMDGHNTWAETGWRYTLTAMPFIDRLWQYYVMPNLDLVAALKSLAPKARAATCPTHSSLDR